MKKRITNALPAMLSAAIFLTASNILPFGILAFGIALAALGVAIVGSVSTLLEARHMEKLN